MSEQPQTPSLVRFPAGRPWSRADADRPQGGASTASCSWMGHPFKNWSDGLNASRHATGFDFHLRTMKGGRALHRSLRCLADWRKYEQNILTTPVVPEPTARKACDTRLHDMRSRLHRPGKEAKLKRPRDFEACFIGPDMKQMRSSLNQGGYAPFQGEESYLSMFDQELSVKMARSGALAWETCSRPIVGRCHGQQGQRLRPSRFCPG